MKQRIAFIGILLIMSTAVFAASYDLETFLNLVEQHSKDLKLAAREQDLAKVTKRQAVSAALPKIAGQADYTRNLTDYYMYADLPFPGMSGPVKFKVNRNNEYSANVALQQTLFSPTVGLALRAASEYQKLTDFVYNASHQAIITSARTMFYQALLLQKFWDVSQSAEKNAKENYDNLKLKFENGVVSEFELLQAEVRWKNAIPQTAQAKRNYNLMLNNMKNWAGIDIDSPMELDGSFDNIPPLPDKPISDTRPFRLILNKRPDYNAMLWEERLRMTNVKSKYAAYLPTLSGSLVYAYTSQSDYWKLEQENGLFMAGLTLSWPLYTGGYRRTEIQKAKIELDKTRINIQKSEEEIYNEVSNIYLQLKEAYERIASAEATLKAAEKAFTIAENTAKSGLATQLQLKDARVGYDMAMMNYYAATFDYLSAYFQWERATGNAGSE